jgi:hypothetical protein
VEEEAIAIRLTRDQAFVLSDWLYQVMFQSYDFEGIVHDRAGAFARSSRADGSVRGQFVTRNVASLRAVAVVIGSRRSS